MIALLLGSALALERPSHPVTLVGGSTLGYGTPSSFGASTEGRLLVRAGNASFDVAAREGWAWNDSRLVGALFFGGRWAWSSGVYVRVGFAHNHEVPQDQVVADPWGSFFGSGDGIRHRSGLGVGTGWVSKPLGDDFTQGRVRLGLDLEASAFPDDKGPLLYTASAGQVHISVGPSG